MSEVSTTTTNTPYIPAGITSNLKDQNFRKIMLGIQGAPGCGKTTSALTFPNPYVLNLDGGLVGFAGHDLSEAPFYDHDWVRSLEGGKFKETKPGAIMPNKRDAIKWWLRVHGLKMVEGQTLILDSWTTLQNMFDAQQRLEPEISSKTGKEDGFAFWGKKLEYSKEIMQLLASCKCHVVVTFHEMKERDDEGRLIDKVRPLQQGQFAAEIGVLFTEFFRMFTEAEKDKNGRQTKCKYYWQVKSSNAFEAKSRKLYFPEKEADGTAFYRVEAGFEMFSKYLKPQV
jgi:hypothetical protein